MGFVKKFWKPENQYYFLRSNKSNINQSWSQRCHLNWRASCVAAKQNNNQKKLWTDLIERNPPLEGVSLLGGSWIKEPGGRRPHLKNKLNYPKKMGLFFKGDHGPLPPVWWLGNHPTKKPSRGGGFLSIKLVNRDQLVHDWAASFPGTKRYFGITAFLQEFQWYFL